MPSCNLEACKCHGQPRSRHLTLILIRSSCMLVYSKFIFSCKIMQCFSKCLCIMEQSVGVGSISNLTNAVVFCDIFNFAWTVRTWCSHHCTWTSTEKLYGYMKGLLQALNHSKRSNIDGVIVVRSTLSGAYLYMWNSKSFVTL